jgi:hypothetical protein
LEKTQNGFAPAQKALPPAFLNEGKPGDATVTFLQAIRVGLDLSRLAAAGANFSFHSSWQKPLHRVMERVLAGRDGTGSGTRPRGDGECDGEFICLRANVGEGAAGAVDRGRAGRELSTAGEVGDGLPIRATD